METVIMNEEYKAMQAKALEQLRSGQSLTGKDGAFAPLLKQFIETALASEMAGHLDQTERSKGNKINGKGSKHSRLLLAILLLKRHRIVTVHSVLKSSRNGKQY
jgi:hypothetical protein